MMKTKLLITTAVAALIAGSAYAQSPATPPVQSGPAAGASGSMNSSGSVETKGSVDTKGRMGKQGAAAGATTTGAGATTETNKADDFKTKGASDKKATPQQKGAQQNKSGNKSETTGQAPTGRSESDTNAQQRDGATQPNQPNKSGQTGQTGNNARSDSTTNVNVNLSTEQRTRIKEVIVRDSGAPRVSSVNFSINVGTAVPRTVKHVVVPSTIVAIYPAWRGFHYFMVGEQIVIVDPNTMHIVAVIEA